MFTINLPFLSIYLFVDINKLEAGPYKKITPGTTFEVPQDQSCGFLSQEYMNFRKGD